MLEIREPNHNDYGWITIAFSKDFTREVSYCRDSVLDLINALNSLKSDSNLEYILLFREPAIEVVELSVSGTEAHIKIYDLGFESSVPVNITPLSLLGSHVQGLTPKFEAVCNLAGLRLSVLQSLSVIDPTYYEEAWGHPFPSNELHQLSK